MINWAEKHFRPSWGVSVFTSRTETGAIHDHPKGLAVAPGGRLIFEACNGAGLAARSRLKMWDHKKVKAAIDNDPADSSYNLTGSNPEALDDLIGYWPTIFRNRSGFDGPLNIAFQEFPVVDIYPRILHLAEGGVDEGQDLLKPRVHPIYGDSVTVGISDGSTEHIKFPGSPVTWISQWLGEDREVYGADIMTDGIRLNSVKPGIGKMIAESNGYPSNVAFVTVPPQEFIQILYGEACHSANEITYRALAAVVKNRIRLTTACFNHPGLTQPPGCREFDFPHTDFATGIQIRASNSSEEIATDQITFSFGRGYDAVGNSRYNQSATRAGVTPDINKAKYDMCVKITGDAIYDLLRTFTNDSGMYEIPRPDTNYLDLVDDPTGGSFFFYSPLNNEWDSNPGDGLVSIEEVLNGDTTDGPITQFPQAGNFESNRVCGGMAPFFCQNGTDAIYLQVVVVNGIPLNDCGGVDRNNAPQFIFLRWRNPTDPSVVSLQ